MKKIIIIKKITCCTDCDYLRDCGFYGNSSAGGFAAYCNKTSKKICDFRFGSIKNSVGSNEWALKKYNKFLSKTYPDWCPLENY